MKTEIGEIIRVTKNGGTAEYQVRLPHGEIVIVAHALIRPARMTVLPRGARLRITHDLGRVQSAGTDLSYTLLGEVVNIRAYRGSVIYLVELEDGRTFQLARDKVQPHPKERSLLSGAVVELTFDESSITAARPVKEKDQATVQQVDMEQRTVVVRGTHGDHQTVRLSPDALRQIQVGERLEMEISYAPEGKRKIELLRRPPTAREAAAGSPARPSTESARPAAQASQGRREQPPSQAAEQESRVAAEAFGLDPLVLEQVQRAGHRFEIVAFLKKHARDGLIEWYDLKPGRQARYKQPARPLHPQVRRAIAGALPEFQDFFHHQAGALDAIRANRNLVIVTQTASGKTLSYNPAIFEYLIDNPRGHVLYVFPLNALMMDQVEKINDLVKALAGQGVRVSADYMVGGQGREKYTATAQACPNIIATNPEMLNYLLDRADSDWREFFTGLKQIVVDEVHSYRGIFGVHMTGILRRLLLTARRLGADPRFVLSSATVNNPLDLAARLTSLPESDFVLLDAGEDGSQQADKHWLVLNPDWNARSGRFGNYQEVAADVFVEMLLSRDAGGGPAPLNAILFCRSMREVNTIKKLVDQRLEAAAPALKYKVKAYISASLTQDRKREIYEGLKSGQILGVISTNALEAGIDIGSLDACVIAGFPFSVMTLRQMAGRVGRKKEGVVFFIPFPLSSLDQYYSDHPDLLLSQPPEEFVVDAQNPYIARKHINAAAFPAGMSDADLQRYWGERAAAIVQQAQRDRVMFHKAGRWVGTRRDYRVQDDVYQVGNIRSNAQRPYAICRAGAQACSASAQCFDPNRRACDSRVTLLDQQYVYRDCHPGAVYEATGEGLFRVEAIDDAKRVVRVSPLGDDCLERTYVDADIEMELTGEPRGRKEIAPGVAMAWGDATVTRLFTGYYRYTLQPARRCRRCRKEYDETIDTCPVCHRPTERSFNHSKAERQDFPAPYQQGFRIVLKTVACWLTFKPEIESTLEGCSPCRLPGEQNQVLGWLRQPLDLSRLPARLHLSDAEKAWITEYHQQAAQQLRQVRPTAREMLLFPGIYGQCLLAALRRRMGESRALDLFEALTGYPVTTNLRHICRGCQRTVLLPAMHTLEHAVSARYPSVALGDRSDIGAVTTLGHPATGLPTIFWFDNYEGGLGAAEKIYTLIDRLLETGLAAIQDCTCSTLEGCPRCTYIPDCADGNTGLSKPAGMLLIARLLGRPAPPDSGPFIYRKRRAEEFNKAYAANETVPGAHGQGEEAPEPAAPLDPYQLLRLQRQVHALVVDKAFEARSREIVDETPPVSASQLNRAYQLIIGGALRSRWQPRPGAGPYEILEVLPSASLKMIQQIYRVIALQVHPDANPGQTAWANEMMKQLNAAYERITKQKK